MLNQLLMSLGGQIALYVSLGVLLILLVVMFAVVPIKTWFVALVSGAHVSMVRLIGMKIRRIKVGPIINAYIMARKAGIQIDVVELETHQLAGGDIQKVGGGIFLLTPNNVNIQGSISDEKDGQDIHDNDDINIEW